jgi:indole-3-glycerol phosphate synthase
MSVLQRIFEEKKIEVAEARSKISDTEIKARANDAEFPRGFRAALLSRSGHPLALIAEVKKASPSQGLIRADFDPVEVAKSYVEAGANCLSVLTDGPNFQGSLENLKLCREATDLPCLRKDFLYDGYQVYEARAWGADAILLIVAMLEQNQMSELYHLARELMMDVLVEIHTEEEAHRALELKADLIGVNNRDLNTFKTSIETSEKLLPLLPSASVGVSESALDSREDLARVAKAGARAVLIGTSFCSAPNIGSRVREVMGW